MNKREAKRLARHMASHLILGTLAGGWESIERHAEYGTPDYDRLVNALNELAQELAGGEA